MKNTVDLSSLEKELTKSKDVIKKLKREATTLKKAIWDIINYAEMYVVILDKHMIIRLINHSLAKELGFENERDVIGRCWKEFIPEDQQLQVMSVHYTIAHEPEKYSKFAEFTNDIHNLNGDRTHVKWFNVPINGGYNMTYSMGLKVDPKKRAAEVKISEDSVRTYYRDIIEKDRTMIQSLRDVVIKGLDFEDVCHVGDFDPSDIEEK
jgi:PAS domain S-box-containing protein